jgi:hypothetical protein
MTPITIPVRRGLAGKRFLERHFELSPEEAAKRFKLPPSQLTRIAAKEHFGRNKPKS